MPWFAPRPSRSQTRYLLGKGLLVAGRGPRPRGGAAPSEASEGDVRYLRRAGACWRWGARAALLAAARARRRVAGSWCGRSRASARETFRGARRREN
ncbi:unnamed protein product [Prorocentrum cordatum]|uniref:Uncharacterized protein n=1 Tax=Prorocentrum cordatum TaxID=2364126 RepID=A0ABN9QWY3_9DINO|nr:unnamed protein product [Polarella glacialis]